MAFQRNATAELIKPLEGSITRRFTAGATIAAGEIVSMSADGYIDPSDCANFPGATVLGISLQAAVSGDRVDVVTFGPVVCLTDATPGSLIYASDTAGEPSETVGTKDVLVGIAEAATVLFVRPEFIDRA